MQVFAGFIGVFILFLVFVVGLFFAVRADRSGWHTRRLRSNNLSRIDGPQSYITKKDNARNNLNVQLSNDEGTANPEYWNEPPSIDTGSSESGSNGSRNYNAKPESSQPKKITNMADLQAVISDVQPLLKDVQTLGPIIESVLGLSDSINAKINEYVSVGSEIANLLVTLKSQFNTATTGGKVDFAGLNATLSGLEKKVSVLIPDQQLQNPKY